LCVQEKMAVHLFCPPGDFPSVQFCPRKSWMNDVKIGSRPRVRTP
jgi:hypothetical protein